MKLNRAAYIYPRLSHVPETLDELVSSVDLLENVVNEEESIQAKFIPLEEQFAILDKCEVFYTSEVSTRRMNLANDWISFKDAVTAADEVCFFSSSENLNYFQCFS